MAAKPHIMVVEARFYDDIADELARGALAALEAGGATWERFAVPGAFEIPAAIRMGIARGGFDGYLALGCVIRGETTHYDYVCGESARALQDIAVQYQVPLGYGILTVENGAQAWERARVDRKNKGGDVARACLAMLDLKKRLAPPNAGGGR
jgi:6,7-dimethyl-8-ribityllumazine synthase